MPRGSSWRPWTVVLTLLSWLHAVQGQTIPSTAVSSVPNSLSLVLNSTNPAYILNFTASPLYLTFNIATLGANTSILPTIVVSTTSPASFDLSSRTSLDPSSGGRVDIGNTVSRRGDVWRLDWDAGFANWTDQDSGDESSVLIGLGVQTNGTVEGSLIPESNGNIPVTVVAATFGPAQTLSPDIILLGDTTSNAVLLFSPLLVSDPHNQPTYPNYTLPDAQLPLNAYPGPSSQTNLTSLSTDLTVVVVPTSSSPTAVGLDNSLAAIQAANTSAGGVANSDKMLVQGITQWMSVGNEEGYRTMWVVGNLDAATNYTAWLVDDKGGLSAPIWFSTKEASFPCQLSLPNSICPAIGYSAPLAANTTTTTLAGGTDQFPFPPTTYPQDIVDFLTASLRSFSTSLLTTACGRDLYSHVSTCADCYADYRDWLCRMVVPQCASSSNLDTSTSTSIPPQTIFRSQSTPRVNGTTLPYGYEELLPCLSSCNAADRTCPSFLMFRCPLRGITAQQSYGYLGEDVDEGDGSAALGPAALDRWGWRWCNG